MPDLKDGVLSHLSVCRLIVIVWDTPSVDDLMTIDLTMES
jgi:hypothetical protein